MQGYEAASLCKGLWTAKNVRFHYFFPFTKLFDKFVVCSFTLLVKAGAGVTNISELHTFKCRIKDVYTF